MPRSLLAVLVLLGFGGPLAAAEPATELPWPHQASEFDPDPAVHYGRLANGLGYAVMPNSQPPGKLSLRLLVLAGSRHEDEDERGMAHFLEHMAFNGSEHFPPGTVVETLQELGAAFGSHTNAHTSFDETVYKLDLPDAEPATLATGLRIMADWARRLDLGESEIERERGIILAELRDRDNASQRAWTELLPILIAGRAAAQRMPIGTVEAIESFDAEGMRAFYDGWYRPTRMVLSVVGDVEVEATAAAIEAEFAELRGVGEEPAWSPGELELAEDLLVEVFQDPEFGGTSLMLWREAPHERMVDGPLRRRRDLLWSLGSQILAQRFAAIAERPESAPILGGYARIGIWLGLRSSSAGVTPRPGELVAAAAILEQELRRFAEHGPTSEELETAIAAVRSSLEGAVERAGARTNEALAADLYDAVKEGQVFLAPQQVLAIVEPMLATVSPAEVRAAWAAGFAGRREALVVMSSEELAADPESELRAAWSASRAERVAAPEERAAVAWAYADLPAAPEAPEREALGHGIRHSSYLNRVSAAVLARDEEPGQVLISATLHIDPAPMPSGWQDWLARTGFAAGLGAHSAEDLRRILAGTSVGMQGPAFDGDRAVYTIACRPGDLELACQLLRAALSDPGWRPSAFERSRTGWLEALAGVERDLDSQIDRRWSLWSGGGHPQLRSTTIPEVRSLELGELRAWYDPILATAPLEVAVVGDVDPDQAFAILDSTVGSLPERAPIPVTPDLDARGALYPLPPLLPGRQRFEMVSAVDRAVVQIAWPTVDMGDIHLVRRLGLLRGVVRELLRRTVREEFGEAYSPVVSHSASAVYDDHGRFLVRVGVGPERADAVLSIIDEMLERLRSDGIPPDVFSQVHEPLVAGLDAYRRENRYWLGQVVSRAVSQPQRLDWAESMVEDYRAITRAEIEALAAEYLMPDQRTLLIGVSRIAGATELDPAESDPAAGTEAIP